MPYCSGNNYNNIGISNKILICVVIVLYSVHLSWIPRCDAPPSLVNKDASDWLSVDSKEAGMLTLISLCISYLSSPVTHDRQI